MAIDSRETMNVKRELRGEIYSILKRFFDITRYDDMSKLSIADWESQWRARFILWSIMKAGWQREDEKMAKKLNVAVSSLLLKPILPRDRDLPDTSVLPARFPSVRPIVATEALSLSQDFSKESFTDVINACKAEYFTRSEQEQDLAWQDIDSLYRERTGDPYYKPLLTVDLNTPDELIIEDFRKWLAKERKTERLMVFDEQEMRKGISEKDVSRWIQFRIPAYIDVAIFEHFLQPEGAIRLTDPQKAELLFPEEYDIDRVSRLRKVVQKEAERVMTASFLEKFRAQVIRSLTA